MMLTDGAARDLDEWYAAAYARGGATEATRILDRIEVVMRTLAEGTTREETVPELRQLGRRAERQVVTDEGLRVVFRPSAERVLVVLLAPVRRSFQALLERRLLDG
ncbi:MAG: type II toxin-antitoxin system RelE/ParE family toxin [Trueperaceae bacterium]|nr:type II toxin-antitoxin system RelE/ParE family toxin [Trueperaceae bacterium]MCC6311839.1 type II toxin-antitoxin system RelE/ParE family toxin [Trueperaceae bacterium]